MRMTIIAHPTPNKRIYHPIYMTVQQHTSQNPPSGHGHATHPCRMGRDLMMEEVVEALPASSMAAG